MGSSRTQRLHRTQLVRMFESALIHGVASCVALAFVMFVGPVAAETPGRARAPETAPTEIVIRGGRSALDHVRTEPSVASTVLSGEELHRAGQTTADVLARIPGIQVSRTGAQSDLATASIRGSDSAQVPIYLAGIRINDDVSGSADLSTVPLWMIERVEVFRGNAPEYADRLGMGGAIFFWPKQPRATRLGASAHVGSFGEQGGWLAYEAGSRSAGSIVAVRRTQAENDYLFLNDHGRRFDLDESEERRKNADFVTHDAWAIGRFQLSSGSRVSLVVHAFDRDQGVTGLSVIPAEDARATVRRYLAGATARFACSFGEDCYVEAQASIVAGRLTLLDPHDKVPSLRTRWLHNAGTRHTYVVRGATGLSDEVALGASATQGFESIRITRLENLPRSADRTSTRLASTLTWTPSSRVSLHALGAVECHTTRGSTERFNAAVTVDSGSCGTFGPSGRLGMRFGVTSGFELLANAGRYVRIPTLGELYGSSPLVQGNPNLDVERGWTADAGFRSTLKLAADSGVISVESFAFARFADDLIRFQRTGLSSSAPFNVESARTLGVEAAIGGEFLGVLRVNGAATLLDPKETTRDPAQDPTTNDVLTLTSKLAANLRVEVFGKPGFAALSQDRVGIAVAYLYRSSRFADPAGKSVLPAQNLFDVEATTAHFDSRLLARLALRNAFDSRKPDLLGLPVPGRSLHGEVEAWF